MRDDRLRWWIGILDLDMTERKRAERAFQSHRELLTGILATASDAVVAINAHGEVVVFNEAAQTMFGVSADEVRGRSAERFVPLRTRQRYREMLAAFVAGGQVSQMINTAWGLTALRADGTEFPIEASISRLGLGKDMLMTLFVRDVTQLRSTERARAAQVAAEAANHAKTKFLSMMSHELRTPLNAVLGFSQLLHSDEEHPLTDLQRDQVAHIRRAGEHLLALINNTLDITSIESGQFHVTQEPVDVPPLVSEAIRMIGPQARQAGIQVMALSVPGAAVMSASARASASTSGSDIKVMADPVRLRQVILNLLSNAIKYNRPGGTVRTTIHVREHEVRIGVADTGRGMNPAQVRQLFEPFNRLGREREGIEGTGLGLALTRQLVMLMEGEIAVESEVGRGTQVSLTFTALQTGQEPPQQLPLLDDDPTVSIEATMEPEGVVLYIEDEPVNRMIVDQLLSRWPMVRLVQADTGREGIDLARSIHPDLVLLDMGLPDLSGEQVLQALRRDPATVNLPVVVLSGSTMAADMLAVERHGVLDFWAKPLDFDRFVTDMMRCLPLSSGRPSTWGQY